MLTVVCGGVGAGEAGSFSKMGSLQPMTMKVVAMEKRCGKDFI